MELPVLRYWLQTDNTALAGVPGSCHPAFLCGAGQRDDGGKIT